MQWRVKVCLLCCVRGTCLCQESLMGKQLLPTKKKINETGRSYVCVVQWPGSCCCKVVSCCCISKRFPTVSRDGVECILGGILLIKNKLRMAYRKKEEKPIMENALKRRMSHHREFGYHRTPESLRHKKKFSLYRKK